MAMDRRRTAIVRDFAVEKLLKYKKPGEFRRVGWIFLFFFFSLFFFLRECVWDMEGKVVEEAEVREGDGLRYLSLPYCVVERGGGGGGGGGFGRWGLLLFGGNRVRDWLDLGGRRVECLEEGIGRMSGRTCPSSGYRS
jgi:hypothetical protein